MDCLVAVMVNGSCSIYQRAIEVRERVEGKNVAIGRLMHIIGWFLDDMALYSSALPFKERSLEIHEKISWTRPS